MSTLEPVVDCLEVMEEGCCTDVETRDVIDIIETVVKHERKIRRLLKVLKKAIAICCASTEKSSSGDEQK
jgi:hypothetical protein